MHLKHKTKEMFLVILLSIFIMFQISEKVIVVKDAKLIFLNITNKVTEIFANDRTDIIGAGMVLNGSISPNCLIQGGHKKIFPDI